jgi:hypothetical protein
MVGDSHTVGAFGNELTNRLRSTGAKVSSYGSAGSSPSWWMDGTPTHTGYVGRNADGSVDQPANWRTPHATPNLEKLLQQQHPDTLMVNMGANFRGATPQAMQQQVDDIGKLAKKYGTRLIWVGPPNQRTDIGNPSSMNAFNQAMQKAVSGYGTYVPSSPYTPAYGGPDGVHYDAAPAKKWADQLFNHLQS